MRGLRAVRNVRVIGAALLLTGATAGVLPPSAAAGARAGAGGRAPSSLLYAGLFGVAATSASNAWAVGQYQSGTVLRTLIVHWNGKTWRQVPSPNPAAAGDTLSGVAATSAASVWAVGGQNGNSLILHWNGKTWRQVPAPNIGNLASVAATSATSAWAVGIGGGGTTTAIEHWNGKTWRVVPSPVKVGNLQSVTATSATNAWAVGFRGNWQNSSALAEHWNGKAWSVVHSPDPAGAGTLLGVAALSASSAWAVSGAGTQALDVSISVINHWNGRTWTRVTSPNPAPDGASFYAVAASSAGDAWAVGTEMFYLSFANVIAHWNGKAWKLVASPISDGILFGVTATSATDAWAVGSGDAGALIMHWNGARWSGLAFG